MEECVYFMELNREADLGQTDKRQSVRCTAEQGVRFSLQAGNTLGENTMVDIFCTHYQHSHTGQKGKLCHLPLGPEALGSLT